MAKIKEVKYIDDNTGEVWHHRQFLYWCDGCGHEHAFALNNEGGHHQFNMDINVPTVSPSLVERGTDSMCHSFIKAGVIQYLSDCSHPLAGKIIQLPDVDVKLEEREKLKNN